MDDAALAARYRPAMSVRPGPRFAGFTEGAHQGKLSLPRCVQCMKFHWYPLPRCPHCGSPAWGWQGIAKYARLFTWTVLRRPLHSSLADRTGDIVAIVVPEEAPDVRLVTNLLGTNEPLIGMRLQARFVRVDDLVLVLFEPVAPPEAGSGGRSFQVGDEAEGASREDKTSELEGA
jgi:uncharacterized protein